MGLALIRRPPSLPLSDIGTLGPHSHQTIPLKWEVKGSSSGGGDLISKGKFGPNPLGEGCIRCKNPRGQLLPGTREGEWMLRAVHDASGKPEVARGQARDSPGP